MKDFLLGVKVLFVVFVFLIAFVLMKIDGNLEEKQGEWAGGLTALLYVLFILVFAVITKDRNSEHKQSAWDVSLTNTFTQKLTKVYPEEWDEWRHWISDIMESRTRMQSKRMNHHLVSLITFYRLTRFVFHIGIDKVFIQATRRATR